MYDKVMHVICLETLQEDITSSFLNRIFLPTNSLKVKLFYTNTKWKDIACLLVYSEIFFF